MTQRKIVSISVKQYQYLKLSYYYYFDPIFFPRKLTIIFVKSEGKKISEQGKNPKFSIFKVAFPLFLASAGGSNPAGQMFTLN